MVKTVDDWAICVQTVARNSSARFLPATPGIVIDNVEIFRHVLGKYSTFAATGCADNPKVTPVVAVEKVGYGVEDECTTNKILAFFQNNLLKLSWMSSLASGGDDNRLILWNLPGILNLDALAYGCTLVQDYLKINTAVEDGDRYCNNF